MEWVKPLSVGLALGLGLALTVAYLYPPVRDFDPFNPFWNGLSGFYDRYKPKLISSLIKGLSLGDPRSYALLIIGPEEGFSEAEAKAVAGFLKAGGLLVLADDFGTGNQLLRKLGLNVRLAGYLLIDPLFKYKSGPLPKAYWRGRGLILDYATAILGKGFKVLASTSDFSFLDLNSDFEFERGEPKGPFPVAVEANYGEGEVVVISDPSLFINSAIGLGSNRAFVSSIISGRKVLLDVSHWHVSKLALFKAFVNSLPRYLGVPEVRYSVLASALALIYYLKVRLTKPRAPREVEEVLKRHPGWDRKALEEVWRDVRKGEGVSK